MLGRLVFRFPDFGLVLSPDPLLHLAVPGMAPVFAAAASPARLLLAALVFLAAQECSVAPTGGFWAPCGGPGSRGAREGEDSGRASGGRTSILDTAPCGMLPASEQGPTSQAVHLCGQRFATEIEGGVGRRSLLLSLRGGDAASGAPARPPKPVKKAKPAENAREWALAPKPKPVKKAKRVENGEAVKDEKSGESTALSKAKPAAGAAGENVEMKDVEGKESAFAPRLTGTPFEELTPKLNSTVLAALASMGFTSTAPVQLATIPLLLTHKDVAVEAPTGSGKTVAFLVPAFQLMISSGTSWGTVDVGAVIIVPTRELAAQIGAIAEIFSSFTGDRSLSRVKC